MPKTILIIDDDQKLVDLLTEYLARFEFETIAATDPDRGISLLRKKSPDLVILDVMLPGRNGFEVCKEIRTESEVPIVMLTARGEVTDRVVGLELGADDYLAKPFEPRELVARIQSILRRGTNQGSGRIRLQFGDLVIDTQKRNAMIANQEIELSTAEFEVLLLLASNPKRVFTRDNITDKLHGTDWASFDRSIDVLVSRLRQKLGDDPKHPRFIKTVWGTGYKFIVSDNTSSDKNNT